MATATPLSMAALIALGIYIDQDLRHRADELAQEAAERAKIVATHIDQHRTAIDAHAASIKPNDEERYKRTLGVLATTYPGFLTLLIADAEGKIIAAAPAGFTSQLSSVTDRDYFRVPKHTLQPFTSGVFRGRGFGTDPIIALSAPILADDTSFQGIVEGSLNLRTLDAMVFEKSTEHENFGVLFDHKGTVIASDFPGIKVLETISPTDPRLSPADTIRQHDGMSIQYLNGNRSHLISLKMIDFTRWQLALLQPYLPLAQIAATLTLLTIMLCLTIMLASHLFAASFSRVIAAPLDDLLQRIRGLDLADADTLHPVDMQTPVAEIQELAVDFNDLVNRQTAMYGQLRASLTLLDAANQELEHRVNERTLELVNARDSAQHMANVKSAFLANMSHELRTPLTAIIGFTEQALRQSGTSTEVTEALEVIARNSNFLLDLVNDILDASKLEFDKIELEQVLFSPLALVRDIVATTRQRAESKAISLSFVPEFPLPRYVSGDPTRIKQVLFNIIGNAVKFTEEGGVTVSLSAESTGQEWQISVRDSGIGMTAEQQQKLFQPFVQADVSTTRKFGGSGLGLFISRQLILRMGGTFLLESVPGNGCQFVITLPTEQQEISWLGDADCVPESEASSRPLLSVPSLSGKVLIADDVEDLRRLVSLMVASTGAEIRVVENGAEARDAALADSFDLILMDMHMPVLDGSAATAELRALGYRGPIVALTADVMATDIERFKASGCDDLLAKPIKEAQLLAVLTRYLAKRDTAKVDAPADAVKTATAGAAPESIRLMLEQLSKQFAARLSGDLDGLRQGLADADWSRLKGQLHKLKGAAGTFGFPAISSQAERAYQQLQKDDFAAAGKELSMLFDAIEAVIADRNATSK
ncbi:hybrid sensor histidine kinase/response regulator [Permianibacter fluminis]|uniref:hybrid sensor histidine kinase/response regulator n=1 Tax=Permianibacter fluminis TaxID=2738515 RepID=UPI002E2BF9DD|nr:ATP-binding protein [Permianibacter fluminis]